MKMDREGEKETKTPIDRFVSVLKGVSGENMGGEGEKETKTIEIDPKMIKPGMCRIDSSLGERLAICKSDDGKIRIFKVEE